jgi:glycosyltransferase involved in cell wall biosynthesis
MKNILIWDTTSNKPYTMDTLRNEALGGTEASVLRLSKALVQTGHYVAIYQSKAEDYEGPAVDGINHVGLESMFPKPDVVIHLRTAQYVNMLRTVYPDAKHFVWVHDVFGEWVEQEPFEGADIICVSDYHKNNIITTMRQYHKPPGSVTRIYNMVGAMKTGLLGYPKSAIFLSSPHKGLDQVLEVFKAAKEKGILDTLYVLNPGYMETQNVIEPGVIVLGEQTHGQAMNHLARSSVLLYPQRTWPETFGYVFAEAAALGVPVLAYDHGAAREVLPTCNPPYRCKSVNEWLNKLQEVLAIKVDNDKIIDNAKILAQWEEVLNAR